MRMIFSALFLLLPALADAADPAAPVREVMAAAQSNWKELADDRRPAYVDYFSDDFLQRLYSRAFTEAYRAALKYPEYDEGSSPFDYDVITMGQDGCELREVEIEPGATQAGRTDVKVTFDNSHCFGQRAADWKPSEVHFLVVEEEARPVIDDIVRQMDGPQSLKNEMKEIVRAGQSGSP